jgi:hypothetical protein
MRSLRCGPCFFQFLYSMVVIIDDCCSERHRSRHPELGRQWRDLLAEIGFIGPVDFGGDLQGNAQRPRYWDGAGAPAGDGTRSPRRSAAVRATIFLCAHGHGLYCALPFAAQAAVHIGARDDRVDATTGIGRKAEWTGSLTAIERTALTETDALL